LNLKAFHIAFVTAAVLLSAGLGVWCLREHAAAQDGGGTLLGAALSFAAAAGLVVYGAWFLKKVKGL
jgi:hypothetical protein